MAMSLEPLSSPPTSSSCFHFFRIASLFVAALNFVAVASGSALLALVFHHCGARQRVPMAMVTAAAAAKITAMAAAAVQQRAAAMSVVSGSAQNAGVEDQGGRLLRKMRYKRWVWWSRTGMGVSVLQFVAALYLMVVIIEDLSYNSAMKQCYLGEETEMQTGKHVSVILFLILSWLVAIIQCFTGFHMLRWRSFYSTHDAAWKAHYLEVFDHGIREVMCCLGRVKYLSALEEDEVFSVAKILGELVAYRACGTGHLNFLAGLSLLQRYKQAQHCYDEHTEAPEARVREAVAYHHFAEASYTGPLLDFGRNPFTFPCIWIHRQAVLTPWTRSRRPSLEGDNWWRGHAAAFLKFVNLDPNCLIQGRIRQTKRESAYFVSVLHDLRTLVIAVRGTETPEDLLTDIVCKECTLTNDDLYGLISENGAPEMKEKVISSRHYGHSGIVESARELFLQLEKRHGDGDVHQSKNIGLLASLLVEGGECHGYRICIVGHSLGGSVAALLGIRLYGQYPNLHVYAYGPLPCLDPTVAEACSEFVTSIVYNDEFSSRLSVNSILRLRAAAFAALSEDSSANSMITKFVPQTSHYRGNQQNSDVHLHNINGDTNDQMHRRNLKDAVKGGAFLCTHAISCLVNMPVTQASSPSKRCDFDIQTKVMSASKNMYETCTPKIAQGSIDHVQELYHQDEILLNSLISETVQNSLGEISIENVADIEAFDENDNDAKWMKRPKDLSFKNHKSDIVNGLSSPVSNGESLEMFLPGLIVHVVPEQKGIFPRWKGWKLHDKMNSYRAFVGKREDFSDIVVTPSMFLDHLPWRCYYALCKAVDYLETKNDHSENLQKGLHAV